MKTLLILAVIALLIALAVAAIISALAKLLRFGSGVIIGVVLACAALIAMGPQQRERVVHTVERAVHDSVAWVRVHVLNESTREAEPTPSHSDRLGGHPWHA